MHPTQPSSFRYLPAPPCSEPSGELSVRHCDRSAVDDNVGKTSPPLTSAVEVLSPGDDITHEGHDQLPISGQGRGLIVHPLPPLQNPTQTTPTLEASRSGLHRGLSGNAFISSPVEHHLSSSPTPPVGAQRSRHRRYSLALQTSLSSIGSRGGRFGGSPEEQCGRGSPCPTSVGSARGTMPAPLPFSSRGRHGTSVALSWRVSDSRHASLPPAGTLALQCGEPTGASFGTGPESSAVGVDHESSSSAFLTSSNLRSAGAMATAAIATDLNPADGALIGPTASARVSFGGGPHASAHQADPFPSNTSYSERNVEPPRAAGGLASGLIATVVPTSLPLISTARVRRSSSMTRECSLKASLPPLPEGVVTPTAATTATLPAKASRLVNGSGSDISVTHNRMLRTRKTQNFDFGLHALGFPVQGCPCYPETGLGVVEGNKKRGGCHGCTSALHTAALATERSTAVVTHKVHKTVSREGEGLRGEEGQKSTCLTSLLQDSLNKRTEVAPVPSITAATSTPSRMSSFETLLPPSGGGRTTFPTQGCTSVSADVSAKADAPTRLPLTFAVGSTASLDLRQTGTPQAVPSFRSTAPTTATGTATARAIAVSVFNDPTPDRPSTALRYGTGAAFPSHGSVVLQPRRMLDDAGDADAAYSKLGTASGSTIVTVSASSSTEIFQALLGGAASPETSSAVTERRRLVHSGSLDATAYRIGECGSPDRVPSASLGPPRGLARDSSRHDSPLISEGRAPTTLPTQTSICDTIGSSDGSVHAGVPCERGPRPSGVQEVEAEGGSFSGPRQTRIRTGCSIRSVDDYRSIRRTSTFLSFGDDIRGGSRGFSCLVLSSYLRHAGPNHLQGALEASSILSCTSLPKPVSWPTQESTSPPSASAATMTMPSESGGAPPHPPASVLQNTSRTSGPSPFSVDCVITRPTSSSNTVESAHQLRVAGGERGSTSGTVAQQFTFSSVSAPTSGVSGPPPGISTASAVLRLGSPDDEPQDAPKRRDQQGSRPTMLGRCGCPKAAAAPVHLMQRGVLHWSKPLIAYSGGACTVPRLPTTGRGGGWSASPAHLEDRAMANLSVATFSLPDVTEKQAVLGLAVLERRLSNSPSKACVFTVDGGYTVRVVQEERVGDCEMDETVARCTTDEAAVVEQADAAIPTALPPAPPPLPSVLLDVAVRRFLEEGENAIVVVMDTADEFRRSRGVDAVAAPQNRPAEEDSLMLKGTPPSSTTPHLSSFPGATALSSTGVVRAICDRIVKAFFAYKSAQATAHPELVVDLKMAVALVPVSSPRECRGFVSASSGAKARPSSPSLGRPCTDDGGAVYYDVVHAAAAAEATSPDGDCRRPLQVATSPLFGSCLNECRWLVVEDAEDVAAVWTQVRRLALVTAGMPGFIHLQFLCQIFHPAELALHGSATCGGPATSATAFQVQDSDRDVESTQGPATTEGDIVVSSFTITASHLPEVVESILDRRTGTPWPLLCYAMAKGLCTVLSVVSVHEEDAEAAYPLSLLQRMKAMRLRRPRRGSVRSYVADQRRKIADLRRKLDEAASTAAAAPWYHATVERQTALLAQLECNVKDAEDFLSDRGSAHLPVYVGVPLVGRTPVHGENSKCGALPSRPRTGPNGKTESGSGGVPATPRGVVQVWALMQSCATATGSNGASRPAPQGPEGSTVAQWLAFPTKSPLGTLASTMTSHGATLTSQLPHARSTAFHVDEIAMLHGASDVVKDWRRCATWRMLGSLYRGGFNCTVVVTQEGGKGTGDTFSLRVMLELLHGIQKETWELSCPTVPRSALVTGAAASPLRATADIMRVSICIYHLSGVFVADLLRETTSSGSSTDVGNPKAVLFRPTHMALHPLTGAVVPLGVSTREVKQLRDVEEVLHVAIERLRAAQMAASAALNIASRKSDCLDPLTRECLLAPGYTVVALELTQRMHCGGNDDPTNAATSVEGADDDVLVNTMTVVNMGGHYTLLREVAAARSGAGAEGEISLSTTSAQAPVATSRLTVEKDVPTSAATVLAQLLVGRPNHIVVCAAALPAYPTTETVEGLLRTVVEFRATTMDSAAAAGALSCGSVRKLVERLRAKLHSVESTRNAPSPQMDSMRDVIRRAFEVLRDPHIDAFGASSLTPWEVAAHECSPPSREWQDGATAGRVTEGDEVTCSAGLSSSPPSSSSTSARAVPTTTDEESTGFQGVRSICPLRRSPEEATRRETWSKNVSSSSRRAPLEVARGEQSCASLEDDTAYYGTRYDRDDDPPFRHCDIPALYCRQIQPKSPCTATAVPGTALREAPAATAGDSNELRSLQLTSGATAAAGSGSDEATIQVPTVLLLNAATTDPYVQRRHTRVLLPIPTTSPQEIQSFAADDLVHVKPTSAGIKSPLLMRTVSCVSQGRTAALCISDTESCDAASSMAWLALRAVVGGIFEALQQKECEGVRHYASIRAFLMEEDHYDVFADLLAPKLSTVHPRQERDRLKYSPFCGPVLADLTAAPVTDLRDVNSTLALVLFGTRLARQSSTCTEQLRGCLVLQLIFHQCISLKDGADAPDMVVSSLWCIHMGCNVSWLDALGTAPHSATSTLLRFWLGGPCYTTAIIGLSRYVGVCPSTWRALATVRERLRAVKLRLPRYGSVRRYAAYLERCLSRLSHLNDVGDQVGDMVDGTCTPQDTSVMSAPRTGKGGPGSSPSKLTVSDAVTRVTALLKEAQRMLERGCDEHKASRQYGLLAHEEKMFAALE